MSNLQINRERLDIIAYEWYNRLMVYSVLMLGFIIE